MQTGLCQAKYATILLMKKYASIWRRIAAIGILSLSIGAFVYYFRTHPEVIDRLSLVSPWQLGLVLLLYGVSIGGLAFVNAATLALCNVRLPNRESALLTMYSSVVNFFGPLQSGPAVRALYLKQKYNLKLSHYTAVTMVYYIVFAAISGMMLLSRLLGVWLLPLAALGVAVLAYIFQKDIPFLRRFKQLRWRGLYMLAIATAFHLTLITCIYFIELRAILPGVTFGQAIIYTGAANFALFVSVTPGAIGFRESFLLFSQRLHGIDSNTIILASAIDRVIYIVFLLILVVAIFMTHASKRFATSGKD
jgi:uncharacterized membrane protein YbhN (UPF0104 family)